MMTKKRNSLVPADSRVLRELRETTKELERNAMLEMKEASVARTLADASAALKAGTLKQLTSSPAQVRRLRVRTPHEVLLSVTKPVAEAQVKAYIESHYPGKEQPDFEPLTDAQYAVLERASPRKRGRVLSSIQDILTPAPMLQLQLANDFAMLLLKERGQKAVVQHLYDEIGQSSVATLLGAKR